MRYTLPMPTTATSTFCSFAEFVDALAAEADAMNECPLDVAITRLVGHRAYVTPLDRDDPQWRHGSFTATIAAAEYRLAFGCPWPTVHLVLDSGEVIEADSGKDYEVEVEVER